jgi:hypothetical protein
VKKEFYMDTRLYEHMRGTFIGLFLCLPGKIIESGRILAQLQTMFSPSSGTKFELTQSEFDCLIGDLEHHYNSLQGLIGDEKIPRTQKENYSQDADKVLLISRALLEQGKTHGMSKSGAFAGKKIC